MLIKNKTFKGGYRFLNIAGQPRNELVDAAIPKRVVIPFRQGFGNEVPCIVKPGDRLLAGQIIARDDDSVSSPIHSSVNGTVKELTSINYFNQVIGAAIIESDGTKDQLRLEGFSEDWGKLPAGKIEELIYLSGVSALDREGIPTRFRSSIISPEEVENVIVHGVSSEVFNISTGVILGGKNFFKFIEGIKILKRILPNARFQCALNRYDNKIIEESAKLLSGNGWIDIYPLEPKYPQGYDEVLIPTILGKKFPYGYSAANIGVVVLNIQAVIQAYEAVAEGRFLIERIIALCGEGFTDNYHIKARIGTQLRDIVAQKREGTIHPRFVLNSLLTGHQTHDMDLPLTRIFSQLICVPEGKHRKFLAFMGPGLKKDSYTRAFAAGVLGTSKSLDTNYHGEERACIFCNFCQAVCPVSIIPHIFYHHVKKEIIEETLLNLGIYSCIECKLCSYVCPSKIPLAKYIKKGQSMMQDKCFDRSLCVLPLFDMKGLEEYRGIK